jgi:maltose phosphorylase
MVMKWKFNELQETERWEDIIEKMYFPFSDEKDIYLQQDGFLDKDLKPVAELPAKDLPINQNWSWDRILRSPYIKQADTLQSLYLFQEDFTEEDLKRHFDFYEPLTVHESSLSPCVHSILAAKIGYQEKAYEMYLRTSRLDLDDYNNDTEDGLHITSMGGTWMSFVMAFGGMRVVNGKLNFNPFLPESWKSYAFRIDFDGAHLEVMKERNLFKVINHSAKKVKATIWNTEYVVEGNVTMEFKK